MFNSDKSIFELKISPFIQGGVVLLAILSFTFLGKLVDVIGLINTDAGTPWLILLSFTLFFIIFNSVLSVASDDQNTYWWQSLLTYVILAISGGFFTSMVSGISIDEAGTYRWLYVVFTFGYIVFLGIMRSIRKIVSIAKKQDNRLRGGD